MPSQLGKCKDDRKLSPPQKKNFFLMRWA